MTFFFTSYRYLFWTDSKGFLRRINFLLPAPRRIVYLARDVSWPYSITLDYANKRVYWFVWKSGVDHISSSDYDGVNQKNIKSGLFNNNLLSVFGDFLYFLNYGKLYINEINISNGTIYRSILVDKAEYYDLIVVDSSIQPSEYPSIFIQYY